MNIQMNETKIPGTVLKKTDMGNVTGLDFLNKIFYITDGIMLSQIREISGIDGSTLQNWTKRGWVESAKLKKYNIDQVAHILIINMLRGCMQLDRIAFLIRYINGSVDDRADDIIRVSISHVAAVRRRRLPVQDTSLSKKVCLLPYHIRVAPSYWNVRRFFSKGRH